MDEIDALLMGMDENEQRKARQRLLGFAHDPAVREYLDAEARLALHRDRVRKQVGVVDKIMTEAERDVSHLVTTKWIHQAGKHDDRFVSSAMHMGPQLTAVTADLRVQECMKMLLGGSPRFVDDVTFIAQMSTFAHPTETMDSSCVAVQKLITEAYGTAHELTACVNAEHATKLISMVANARCVYASMAQLTHSLHSNAVSVRAELEDLQGKMEVLQQHHQKALRVGREVIKENELLRRQLFKAAVQQQSGDATEDSNVAMLSEKGLEQQRQLSDRVIVLLQVEGCHELRFKQPTLVSHALLVLQSVVESVAASRAGTRINYNPLRETREHFNRGSNRRFPSESYAYSFADASDAFLFTTELHDQLAQGGRWPDELLELPQFGCVQANDGTSNYVWRGLKVRMAVHSGIPFVTYPLADLDDAGKKEDDVSSTKAMTSVIPFYGGLVMEKVMLLLQKARPGETLATADVTKWFEKERFAKPELSHTLSIVERILTGLQVGFSQEEKFFAIVPRTLQLRVSDVPPFSYPDVVSSIFPTATFWRQIDQSNEFSQQDFEDDQHRILAATSLLPHQYEEKIHHLEEELAKSHEARNFLTENTNRLNADAIRIADELNKCTHQLKAANEKIVTLQERNAKMPNLSRRGEAATMYRIDLLVHREDTISKLQGELHNTKTALEAAEAEITEMKRFKGIDEDTNTEVPYPEVATAVAEALANRDKRDEARSRDAALSRRDGAPCTTCDSLVARLQGTEHLLTKCADCFKSTLQAELTAAELIAEFNKHLAVFLDSDYDPQTSPPPSVTYERINDGSVADGMFSSPNEKNIVFAVAAATRVVTRFAITKALNQRMKGLSQATGDEIEYLMSENSKLEAKLSDLTVARRKENEDHRAELIKVQLENVKELSTAEEKGEGLANEVKRLNNRLGEMTDRAQRFFEETCQLVNQLETTRATNEHNMKVKQSFDDLVQTQYTPFMELTTGEKLLRDTNSNLRRQLQVLEAKVKARETELALKDRFIRDSNLGHAYEMELARENAAAEERRLAEEELNGAIDKIEADERLKKAQLDVEQRKQRAEEESKAEHRRRQDEKKRDELRAARDEMEREEWKRTMLETLVEEEVQKRIEQWHFANRYNASNSDSASATPLAQLPPLPTGGKRKKGSDAAATGGLVGLEGSVSSRPNSGSKANAPATKPTHATSPAAAVAVIPDNLAKSSLPLSSMPGAGSSSTPPPVSSARTFVCTSCSQRFVLRRTDSLNGGESISERPDSRPASATRWETPDGHNDTAVPAATNVVGVDHETQSSFRVAGPTVKDATSSTRATPIAVAAQHTVESLAPPNGEARSMATTSSQTMISVSPADNVVPIVQSLEGLEMFNNNLAIQQGQTPAMAAMTETSAAHPATAPSDIHSERAGATTVSSGRLDDSPSPPPHDGAEAAAPSNLVYPQSRPPSSSKLALPHRPVLLRAIAVGDGYIVLTADAASSMDEVWVQDQGTQADLQAAPTVAGTLTATGSSKGLSRAGSGNTPKGSSNISGAATAAPYGGAGGKATSKSSTAEALRKAVQEAGRAAVVDADSSSEEDASEPAGATASSSGKPKKVRPVLVHVGVQTTLREGGKEAPSAGPKNAGREAPRATDSSLASASDKDAATASTAEGKSTAGGHTATSATSSKSAKAPSTKSTPQLHEATQTMPPRQSAVATNVTPQMLSNIIPTHIGIQCDLLTEHSLATTPGGKLALAEMMNDAAKRAAERHAAAHLGMGSFKLATSTGANTVESNARAAIAGGRLQPLSGVQGARGIEVDEYIERTADHNQAAGEGGALFAQHPRLAMQRRAEALIPATLPASGVSPTLVSKLMVGAERDINESTHARYAAQQQRAGASSAGARRSSPNRDVTKLLTAQDYEYVDTTGLEPWKVGARPSSGLSRPLSPRPLKNDDEEDAEELLQRFGLQTRDEVSIRSAHVKTAPVQAKYDVKKKAAPKALVIGKPSTPTQHKTTPTTETPPIAKR